MQLGFWLFGLLLPVVPVWGIPVVVPGTAWPWFGEEVPWGVVAPLVAAALFGLPPSLFPPPLPLPPV